MEINEVAKRLKVSRETVSRYIKDGKLLAFCIGFQYMLFESSLNKLFDKKTRKGSDFSG